MNTSDFEFLEPERPKRRRWLKYLLTGALVVLVGVVAVTSSGLFYVTSQLRAAGIEIFSTDGQKFELPTAEEIKGPISILLIGSDTRTDQGEGYGDSEAELADVIILVKINESRTNAVALSFPRDLMVSVPECPSSSGGDPHPSRDYVQINSTMNYGGPACTLLAVQQLTGLEIPYLAMIDFKGVIAMSEAIGGVEVCVAEPISDRYSKLYLDAGYHTLIGEQALAFLRTRHGVGDGSDLARISNQQVFLTSLVRKLKDEGALTNPFTLFRIGTAALNNMTLSNSLTDLNVIFNMAREVNAVDLDKITFLKLPVYDLEGDYAGRVGLQTERADLLFEKLVNDEELLLKDANFGVGAVVVEQPIEESTEQPTNEPTPSEAASKSESSSSDTTSSAEASAEPSASATTTPVQPSASAVPTEEALPEWAQGTNAATFSCSK